MKYILTMIMCSVIEGQTTCIPPFSFETRYNDAYDCMMAGYKKSSEKIIELGREDVNVKGKRNEFTKRFTKSKKRKTTKGVCCCTVKKKK